MHAHHGVPGERSGVGGDERRGLVTAHFKTLRHFLIGQSDWRGLDQTVSSPALEERAAARGSFSSTL
ncbi:uncharacterized [Tachysurus ichikawai]